MENAPNNAKFINSNSDKLTLLIDKCDFSDVMDIYVDNALLVKINESMFHAYQTINPSIVGTTQHLNVSDSEGSPDTSKIQVSGYQQGFYSHTNGKDCRAVFQSYAEGHYTNASGMNSHTEGDETEASGDNSHAEGSFTKAKGNFSHAEGEGTIAIRNAQHVQGQWNIQDTEERYLHIVGNGIGDDGHERSNAHTLDHEGNAWFQGDVYVSSTFGVNKDEGSKKLATEEFVITEIQKVESAPGTEGPAGYTPVKGVDYYTEADKTEMVNLVLAALPTWIGGSY